MNISGTTMHITDLTIDGESIKDLKSKLSRIYINNAGAHNSLYRGKNLGTSITAAQIAAIQNGSFDDIYPGDYWVFSIDGSTVYAYVAGCNTYKNLGTNHNAEVHYGPNHIILWCHFGKYALNDTDDCSGGLPGMKVYTEIFPHLLSELEKVIPANAIYKQFGDWISDSINSSGVVLHQYIATIPMFLPSLINLGFNWSPSQGNANNIVVNIPWPMCAHMPVPEAKSVTYWLNYAASNTHWRIRHIVGNATSAPVSEEHYLYPYILVG